MSPTADGQPEMAHLEETTKSTLNLLRQFIATLDPGATQTASVSLAVDAPEPLAVIQTSASLLKAHTTKLSLLVLNKPFTPSAIQKVVIELTATCLPAMMSAIEICRPAKYSHILQNELKARVRRVFREMESTMQELLSNTSATSASAESNLSTKDSLASTGVVWEACDSLAELKDIGLVGLVVLKAKQYRNTLEDAIVELREWYEDVADEEDEEDEATGSDGSDSINQVFGAANKLPKDRQDLRELLDKSLKKLKLLSTLYQAISKRRLKTIPTIAESSVIYLSRIDDLMSALKSIPENVDDLASAFYDLDIHEAKALLDATCEVGKQSMTLVRYGWSGEDDEFTSWASKWVEALDRK